MTMTMVMLFQGGDLRLTLENHGQSVVGEIESVPEAHVLQADEVEWAQALAERYSVEAPRLDGAGKWMDEPAPVDVDVSWDNVRRLIRDPSRPAYVPGHQTTVHIPFSGERDVFLLRPSSFTHNPPHAEVADAELRLHIAYPDDRPADIKAEADQFIRQVEQHLETARADVEYFNSGLLNMAQMAIRARRQRIEQHRAHVQETGLPVGPPHDVSKTRIVDAIVRRPAPVLASAPASQPIELEPTLGDEVYDHILAVIRQHALSMERNPQPYADMGEEARRHVILDALNTHYAGAGGAEAFNFGGKTDIVVRHEGRNLFIAECKFWSGAKGFTDTLDQLFGYQAWRDTKLAVLMFVRERNLTTIVERGRKALGQHPQFVTWQDAATETELKTTVSWQGDDRRHADLNVFFISTPAAGGGGASPAASAG